MEPGSLGPLPLTAHGPLGRPPTLPERPTVPLENGSEPPPTPVGAPGWGCAQGPLSPLLDARTTDQGESGGSTCCAPIPQPQLREVCLRAPHPGPSPGLPSAGLWLPLPACPHPGGASSWCSRCQEAGSSFGPPPPAGPRNLLSGSRHALLCGCVSWGWGWLSPPWPDQAIRRSRPDRADSQHRDRAAKTPQGRAAGRGCRGRGLAAQH